MRERVLIVDDHPGFRRLAMTLLRSAGYDVVGEADDAAATLRAVEELRPDVVVLDVQLEFDDGIELAHLLSAAERPPAVVLVSSREAADYGERLRNAPVQGFVSKRDFSGSAVGSVICRA